MRYVLYRYNKCAVCASQLLTLPFHVGSLQVGVNVNLDASYLFRDHKVEVANTVDLRTYARHCLIETPSSALTDMACDGQPDELPGHHC